MCKVFSLPSSPTQWLINIAAADVPHVNIIVSATVADSTRCACDDQYTVCNKSSKPVTRRFWLCQRGGNIEFYMFFFPTTFWSFGKNNLIFRQTPPPCSTHTPDVVIIIRGFHCSAHDDTGGKRSVILVDDDRNSEIKVPNATPHRGTSQCF